MRKGDDWVFFARSLLFGCVLTNFHQAGQCASYATLWLIWGALWSTTTSESFFEEILEALADLAKHQFLQLILIHHQALLLFSVVSLDRANLVDALKD